METPKDADNKMPAWRWWLFIIVFVLFPIALRPWWLAILCVAAFCLLMMWLYPGGDT